MSNELEQLVEEVGAADFRPLTEDRVQSIKDSSFRDYDPDANTTMTLDQAKRFSDAAEGKVASTRFDSDDEFFETWERVLEDWPEVEVRFAGMIGEYGYLDAVYLVYDELYGGLTPRSKKRAFEEYCVVHFKNWMPLDPAENKGVCPVCDDRVDAQVRDEDAACRDFDDDLWAAPDEFNFREYPQLGECLRMWWDD